LIDNTNWHAPINDINVSLQNWEQQFMHIMNVSIPKGTVPKRQNHPWLLKTYEKMQLPVPASKKNKVCLKT